MVFVRATFAFPKAYPSAPPRIELDKNAGLTLKNRAYLLHSLRR
jgi:hypothetical protein